jgi:microcystin-dependent protein
MSEPFLAEVRIFSFNFPPRGWAQCDGQILPINQNQSLYSLLGTTYGGDGRTTFALPDLRGRAALHEGDGISLGATGLGAETHALSVAEMPSHAHALLASSGNASSKNPAGNVYARAGSNTYHAPGNAVALHAGTVTNQGSGQGHENMQPFQVVNFCIALQGLFPSRN